jgi:UDP-N-acetylmuramate dehydrogenase
MTPEIKDALQIALQDQVLFDEPLAPKVAFRIGGPADALVRPRTDEALQAALKIARDHAVPLTVLGTGSNVLISDRGIRGIVLRLSGELADVHVDAASGELEAGAGALNAPLVALAFSVDRTGIEFLATIPGTFGGALIMNAGAHGGEIGPFVRSVTLIDRALNIVTRPGDQCGFAYRTSGFLPGEILTRATLLVPKGDATKAREHLADMRKRRKATQPLDRPNAGSIFKNPPGDYAGRLIEACALKGLRVGGAEISPLHANFIVNSGGASANDVVALAAEAQKRVKDRFDVELEWEVKRLGEW